MSSLQDHDHGIFSDATPLSGERGSHLRCSLRRSFQSSSRLSLPVELPGEFDIASHDAAEFSFGAPDEDEVSIAASGVGICLQIMKTWLGSHPQVWQSSLSSMLSLWPCLLGLQQAGGESSALS